tara:strand:+ start:79241 stop:80425 length:1185 start_codon:yes stop_codon:yes gene_type:complete
MNLRPGRLVFLLAALTAFVPLSIDAYLPALPSVALELRVNGVQVQSTISVFLIGLCLGMLLCGPLSDRYGRRSLLLVGIVLYLLATLVCMAAEDTRQLIVGRFVQAIGAAAAAILARTIVRDLFALREAARILSLMHVVTMVATCLAPILGSLLLNWQGWRSIFFSLMVFSAACLVAVIWRLDESLTPENRKCSVLTAFSSYRQLLGEPLALAYAGCMGLSLGGMFTFMTASPFVYMNYFNVSPEMYALLIAINILGVIVMTLLNARFVPRFGPRSMLAAGVLLTLLSCVGLVFFALSGIGGLPLLVALVVVYVGATGLFGVNCIASLMAAYPTKAGAAAGLAIASQFALGALGGFVISIMDDATPMSMCLLVAAAGFGSTLCYGLIRMLEGNR